MARRAARHNLNLLSRFFGWAIERGYATINPVRQIPVGRRPHQAAKTDTPWIDDDALVRKLVAALPSPVEVMFYLGNQSGLRTGEICGLRLSDLYFLDDGVIRVRFSYEGPLKEDKGEVGKVKWVPAALDAPAVLGRWLVNRQSQGAGPEDLVFPRKSGEPGCWSDTLVSRAWREVARPLGLKLTWYQATRHSFVSRNLSRGASLDEVSAAVGHSSPVVTRRYYDHFIRKSYSSGLRAGLGLKAAGDGADVLALRQPTNGEDPDDAAARTESGVLLRLRSGATLRTGTRDE
ncbi:MAG: site-specific integrase [Deltaproteobacteria bacterium]|nr:site-specific integrase [Deltaproteobacteria bacterium]